MTNTAAPRTDWISITVIVLSASAFAAEQGVTYPLISLLLEKRGLAEWLIGANVALFTAGLATPPLIVGTLTAHFSLRELIVGGLVGSAACLALFYVFDAFWVWCLTRFALGFFASLTYVASEAALQNAASDDVRGRMSGFYASGISLGFALGPLAIPIFGTETKTAFLAISLYVLAIGVVAMLFLRSPAMSGAVAASTGVLRWIWCAPLIFCMALAFGYADTVAISLMPVSLVQLGYAESFAALTVTMAALPTVFAQPFVGMVLDRFSRTGTSIACCLLTSACFLLLAVVTHEPVILALYALIGVCTLALYTCALTLLGERYSGGQLIAGSAALSLAYALGGVATIGTSVLMWGFGPLAAPLSVGALMLLFVAVFGASGRGGDGPRRAG